MATRHRTAAPGAGTAQRLYLPAAAAVLAGAFVLASAGCAGTVPTAATHGAPPAGTPAPTRTATPAPTPSTRASATPAGRDTPRAAPSAGVAGRDTAAGFPGAAKPYAEAVLAAWGQRQVARLGDLTTPAVRQQLLALPGLPPDQRWTYQLCDGAAGSSYCSFVNADGDAITLRVLNQQVGAAHATTELRFDRTAYPNEAREYVKGFVEAWRNGNVGRMRALASPAEVEYFNRRTPPSTYQACTFPSGSAWQVRVYDGAGRDYLIRVTTSALGAAHAIAGHIDPAPVPPPCP